MTPHPARRRGFTLVELLVAIGLAIVLLSLAVAVSQSSAFDSYRTTGAADKVSQWLLVAKQRALRDKLPRGVRLVVFNDPTNPADPRNNTVSECLYIESPDPWFPTNPGVVLVVQQVIDEGDPRTAHPSVGGPGLPAELRRVASTRVFVCMNPDIVPVAQRPAVATTLQATFEPTAGPANPNAIVRAGDTLSVPEVPGRGFRIVSIGHSPGFAAFPAGTAANPNGYPAGGLATINPPPGTNSPPVVNSTPHIPVLELVLADFPPLTPGYSKFAPWPASLPPILFSTPDVNGNPTAPQSTPAGPTNMVNPATGTATVLLAQPFATLVTGGFGIYRAARPLLGEPPLRLPKDTVIDLDPTHVTTPAADDGVYGTYTPAPGYPPSAGPAVVDLLFTPAGDLLPNPNNATHPIQVLLVRDITRKTGPTADLTAAGEYDAAGPMALVAVFAKGGTIVTKPVANPQSAGGDPFQFAKDGIAGGL